MATNKKRTTTTKKTAIPRAIPANDTADVIAKDREWQFARFLVRVGSRVGRTPKTRVPLVAEARGFLADVRKRFVLPLDPTVLAMIAGQLDRIDGLLCAIEVLDRRPDVPNQAISRLGAEAFMLYHDLPGEWRAAVCRALARAA